MKTYKRNQRGMYNAADAVIAISAIFKYIMTTYSRKTEEQPTSPLKGTFLATYMQKHVKIYNCWWTASNIQY